MKNIYVVRPTGFNIGNHVIFAGLRKLLKTVNAQDINFISIPASGKYDRFGKPGLSAGSIHEINQYGDGVIVGGGNLLENGELDIDIQALNALRVPLMIMGVSWGRIYDEKGLLVERTDSLPSSKIESLLNKASIVSVRDASTHSFVSKFREDVHIDGCPSINIEAQDSSGGLDSKQILIPIRNPNLMNVLPVYQNQVTDDIKNLIRFIRSLGFSPLLLCHDHRDISFASLFENVEYRYEESVPSFLNLIKSSSVIISYRLHASLPSLVLGKPTINISYDERALSLMHYHQGSSLNLNMMDGSIMSGVENFFATLNVNWQLPNEISASFERSRLLQNKLSDNFKRLL